MVPTKIVQTRRKVPQPLLSLQYSQITAGTRTSPGPSCAMQNMNISAVRTGNERQPGNGQADAAEDRLHERGDADPEGHGPRRLTGQHHGAFAARAARR
jgi:hypothetical protein